jgi:glycosyltransferase involved in cell wall biosynthesis
MKVAMLTPIPPERTGVAHYASMLIPALRQHIDLEVIGSASRAARQTLPADVIYQLGNNPYHEFVYREAMVRPGIAVLHDVVLHHLIVEMTLSRGDADGYISALRENHGPMGEAWARGRAGGVHSELGNFLLPASIVVANRSRAVLVHNQYAAGVLRFHGVRTPIHVVPHPYEHIDAASRRDEIRAHHGFTADDRVIGFFGFLNSSKRPEVVLEAFHAARQRDPRLRLLIVGEPAPNIDRSSFAADGITFTGYVPDEEFAAHYAAIDRLVNLRYPSAGETSGTLIRAFDAGKLVAVSDYAQFAELPDSCVVKIPLGDGEVAALTEFFVRDLPDASAAQQRWLEENARMELTVAGYLAALGPSVMPSVSEAPVWLGGAIPLFPQLELLGVTDEMFTVRNIGDETIRTRTYGTPGYRVIARIVREGRVIDDRWLELPRDLEPGGTAMLELPARGGGTLALYHALEGVPMFEPEPWVRAPIH